MATKDELERRVNEKLDSDIEWSELKKDDLEEFEEMLGEPETLQVLAAKQANEITGGTVEEKVKNWKPGQLATYAMMDGVSLKDTLFK